MKFKGPRFYTFSIAYEWQSIVSYVIIATIGYFKKFKIVYDYNA